MRLIEVSPVLDKFVAEERLLVATRRRNVMTEGVNWDDLQALTDLVMYPDYPLVTARQAMDAPVRIPIQSGHSFQCKADSDSNPKRTPFPTESVQYLQNVTLYARPICTP